MRRKPPSLLSANEARLDRLRRRRSRYPLWRIFLAGLWDLRILVTDSWPLLVGFCLSTIAGTLYFLYRYHDYAASHIPPFTFLTALFETIRMLVFQSTLPLPQKDILGQVLFFLMPLLGLTIVFQGVLNFGRLLLDKASRMEGWQVSLARTYRNHVIIVGLGRVSYRVMIELLEAGCEVVVIEETWNSRFVKTALRLKVPVVVGDARDTEVLQQAGLSRARGLFAGVNDDLLNITAGLAARRLRPDIYLSLRIFNDELDTNLERGLGGNTAFSSSALAAPTLAAAAVSPAIVRSLLLPGKSLGMEEMRVDKACELRCFVPRLEDTFDVRVLRCLGEDGNLLEGKSSREIRPGISLLVAGPLEALEKVRLTLQPDNAAGLLSRLNQEEANRQDLSIIVCGMGKVGYRVVKALHALTPRPAITIVCQPDTRDDFLAEFEALGTRIVYGDARRSEVLRQAGIEGAYSVTAVTSDDLLNLQVGLSAHRLKPDVQVVLRVFSDVLAERMADIFGIHSAFSPSALAAPALAAATLSRGVEDAVLIDGRLHALTRLTVQAADEYAGRIVSRIQDQTRLFIIEVWRGETRVDPLTLETRIEPGDTLVALAEITWLSKRQSAPGKSPS